MAQVGNAVLYTVSYESQYSDNKEVHQQENTVSHLVEQIAANVVAIKSYISGKVQ